MPHPPKPRISIFTSIEGHSSISQAIEYHLKDHFEITTNLHQGPEFSVYKVMYKYSPTLFAIPFHATRFNPFRRLAEFYELLTFQHAVTQQINQQQPNLIICTWFLTNHLLEKISLSRNIPFITVIANPRTNHPMETAPHSINATFDNTSSRIIHSIGVPIRNIFETGWFVRPQFKPVAQKPTLRKKLGLNPNHLTFLFAGGSEGSPYILNTIAHFKSVTNPTQIIFACGANTQLLQRARYLANQLGTKSRLAVLPLPFTTEIHKYIQASDLVVGKAGPNFIFESVACHTPFIVTTHIPGTETVNLDIIRNYNIGYVQENHLKASQLLQRIINDRQMLAKHTFAIKSLSDYNNQASVKLLKLTEYLYAKNGKKIYK